MVPGGQEACKLLWRLSYRSVDIALLVGAVASLGGLGGGVVLALLRVAVGLGALQQRILPGLLVLGLSLQGGAKTLRLLSGPKLAYIGRTENLESQCHGGSERTCKAGQAGGDTDTAWLRFPAAELRTFHVLSTEFCRARAYEKDTCHGLGFWFMAFRFRVASSSDWPPDRNMIPAAHSAGETPPARSMCKTCCHCPISTMEKQTYDVSLIRQDVEI